MKAVCVNDQWFALDAEELQECYKKDIREVKISKFSIENSFLSALKNYFEEVNLKKNVENKKTACTNDKLTQNFIQLSNSSSSGDSNGNSSNCSSIDNGSSNSSTDQNGSISSADSNRSNASSNSCKSNISKSEVSESSYHTVESRDRYDSCLHEHIDSILEDDDIFVDDDDDEKKFTDDFNDAKLNSKAGLIPQNTSSNNQHNNNEHLLNKKINKYMCFQYNKINHEIIDKSKLEDKEVEDNDYEDYISSSEGGNKVTYSRLLNNIMKKKVLECANYK